MTSAASGATVLTTAAALCLLATVSAVPTGEHTCTGITKVPVTVLVNVTVPVTFRSYTWCLRVPPRCSKYTVQLRDRVQLHTEMHNKTITVCCKGFVEMEARCVPACPEGADCPFMLCNRTAHCHCTPGYTGLYCNDPCPRGVWGKDCKRACDCPWGYTCHHLTGDCMVDDRPSRKSTTTTEVTSTFKTSLAPTSLAPTTQPTTTLETVKTPQFKFPPPPWVDAAAGTTPQKKSTTRIIRDETTSPSTTSMTDIASTTAKVRKEEKVKPPFIEFFTPPSETTLQRTVPTVPTEMHTDVIRKKLEEYSPTLASPPASLTTAQVTPDKVWPMTAQSTTARPSSTLLQETTAWPPTVASPTKTRGEDPEPTTPRSSRVETQPTRSLEISTSQQTETEPTTHLKLPNTDPTTVKFREEATTQRTQIVQSVSVNRETTTEEITRTEPTRFETQTMKVTEQAEVSRPIQTRGSITTIEHSTTKEIISQTIAQTPVTEPTTGEEVSKSSVGPPTSTVTTTVTTAEIVSQSSIAQPTSTLTTSVTTGGAVSKPTVGQPTSTVATSMTTGETVSKSSVGQPKLTVTTGETVPKSSVGQPTSTVTTSVTTGETVSKSAVGQPVSTVTKGETVSKFSVGQPTSTVTTSVTTGETVSKSAVGQPASTVTKGETISKSSVGRPTSTVATSVTTRETAFKSSVGQPTSTVTTGETVSKSSVEQPTLTATKGEIVSKSSIGQPTSTAATNLPRETLFPTEIDDESKLTTTRRVANAAMSPSTTTTGAQEPGGIVATTVETVSFSQFSRPPTTQQIHHEPIASPEFKVIKVIKTEQSPIHKFPTTKGQTQHDLVTPQTAQSTPNFESNISSTKEPITIQTKPNKTHKKTKIKDDRSQIIYISPTSKETSPESTSVTTKSMEATNNIDFRKPTTYKKTGIGNEIHFTKVPMTSETTSIKTSEEESEKLLNQNITSILHSLFQVTQNPRGLSSTNENLRGKEEVNEAEIKKLTTESVLMNTKTIAEIVSEILKKADSHPVSTTISPIQLVKKLLNGTMYNFTTLPPTTLETTLPPKAYEDDFTKDIINKKFKYDDLIVPYSTLEKGKKKHDKNKGKLTKEVKEITSIKPDIPILHSQLETTTKQIIYTQELNNKESKDTLNQNPIEIPITDMPNLINQNGHTVDTNIKIKDKIKLPKDNSESSTTDNNIIEDSLAMQDGRRDDASGADGRTKEGEEDLKTESLARRQSDLEEPTWEERLDWRVLFAGLLAGLVLCGGLVWVCSRSHRLEPVPAQLAQSPPIDIQSLEEIFFCPSFTNNYAARINRELQELSYDHPRTSEPLYAEIRH